MLKPVLRVAFGFTLMIMAITAGCWLGQKVLPDDRVMPDLSFAAWFRLVILFAIAFVIGAASRDDLAVRCPSYGKLVPGMIQLWHEWMDLVQPVASAMTGIWVKSRNRLRNVWRRRRVSAVPRVPHDREAVLAHAGNNGD